MRCVRCRGNKTIVLRLAPRYEATCPTCKGTGGAPVAGAASARAPSLGPPKPDTPPS